MHTTCCRFDSVFSFRPTASAALPPIPMSISSNTSIRGVGSCTFLRPCPAVPAAKLSSTVTTTSYTDTGASGSTPYFYKVSAVSLLQGEGPVSAAASAAGLTAKLRFDFADSGATTVDSISGVSLNIVNSNSIATDYHGAVNSGVAGAGKSLDFSVNAYNSPTNVGGPLASTVMNATLNKANFGSISNFTVTFWVKPDTDFYTSPDIVNIN